MPLIWFCKWRVIQGCYRISLKSMALILLHSHYSLHGYRGYSGNHQTWATLNVTTPNIAVQVWKVNSNDTTGKCISVKDVEVEMPEGVGKSNISLSAVTTTVNPQPKTVLEHTTNLINISLEGPGVDKPDFPLVHILPHRIKVLDDPESPNSWNRIVFNLTGEAYCVRYNTVKKLYWWRILSSSAKMSTDISAGGRVLVTINTNASLYIESCVHMVILQINNETIGQLCWPVLDEVSITYIKFSKNFRVRMKASFGLKTVGM